MGEKLLLLLMLIVVWVNKGESVWLNIPKSGNKCVTEEIHNNVVVVGDYVVISDDHLHPTPTISSKVLYLFISSHMNLQLHASIIKSCVIEL